MTNFKPKVDITGVGQNALVVLNRVTRALMDSGQGDLVSQYRKEATRYDFPYLIEVTKLYVDLETKDN